MNLLGIDIGGSGIKGGLVNTESGQLVSERYRIATPRPATPDVVIRTINKIVTHFEYQGALGIGFPGVVVEGTVLSAPNIHPAWINFSGAAAVAKATNCNVTMINDADAAGLAEMRYGAGREKQGVVMIFTLGTGIGSVMFNYGSFVPNTELGHLYFRGHELDAENYCSDRIRSEKGLSWKKWGKRLNEYFQFIEYLFSPQTIIIGGGVSKKYHKFLKHLNTRAKVVPAELRNQAGIVGAALAAV